MRDDSMNCDIVQRQLRQGRELTTADLAHIDGCDVCTDAWLTAALDAKPEVAISEGFAARVAAMAPARRQKQPLPRAQRPWGLVTAAAMITVLLVVWFSGSTYANSWVSVLFVMLVASEIAGLALWLGPKWIGR
jgi:hypothetical protein